MCIVESFKACSLERKLEQWQKLTVDNWVLSTVKRYTVDNWVLSTVKSYTVDNWVLSTVKRYKIEFFKTPFQFSVPKTIDFGETQNQIQN
jgi:hypothetical protein